MVCLGVCIEFACWFYFVLSICADEFCREKIFIDRLLSGGRFLVLCDLILHCRKHIVRYNARHAVLDDGISEFIFSDILAIAEHGIDDIGRNGLSALLPDALFCQKLRDLLISLAVEIEREHFSYNGRIRFIDCKAVLAVLHIAERNDNAVDLTFECILLHAPLCLFGEFGGVKFGIAFQHGFKQNALCSLGNRLLGRDDARAVFL